MSDICIRPLTPEDDVEHLTDLLHRAYAPLAEAGMKFLASHQSVDVTRHRVHRGSCMVGEQQGVIVATIVYRPPGVCSGSPFMDRPDVGEFGQFAVEPSLQRSGIGSMLIDAVEAMGRRDGLSHMALNTSEHAHQLIAYYEKRGYRFIEHVQWRDVNYRSVVMGKPLVSIPSQK
jgi:GNAT superfamily N-acetyltransferase